MKQNHLFHHHAHAHRAVAPRQQMKKTLKNLIAYCLGNQKEKFRHICFINKSLISFPF